MAMQSLLKALFRYKADSDGELLDAIAALPTDRQDDNLRSALRVLNHAHIIDRIFAANLQQKSHGYQASWEQQPPFLRTLAVSMRETDLWYVDYLSTISPDALEDVLHFTFTDGSPGRMSREEMLMHVVTHGGYHRGEAGRLLPEIESTAMRDVFAGYLHRAEPQRRQ